MSKKYVTHITQFEVKVLSEKDWPEGYADNRPNEKWELVEYVGYKNEDGSPHRVWTPKYTLQYEKFTDYSKLKILEKE